MHSSDVQEPFYFYVQEPYYPYGWMVCVCVCAYQQALKFWYVMNTHFVLENKHNTDITKTAYLEAVLSNGARYFAIIGVKIMMIISS